VAAGVGVAVGEGIVDAVREALSEESSELEGKDGGDTVAKGEEEWDLLD